MWHYGTQQNTQQNRLCMHTNVHVGRHSQLIMPCMHKAVKIILGQRCICMLPHLQHAFAFHLHCKGTKQRSRHDERLYICSMSVADDVHACDVTEPAHPANHRSAPSACILQGAEVDPENHARYGAEPRAQYQSEHCKSERACSAYHNAGHITLQEVSHCTT